ncbi:D-tyrosyl-tRNA(Tyr) deacylase [Thermococcus guaymasensis DSM 11113]|uniref:D-aminoacyl-tRNA deacylase n=1 Tax=Thermococcus guaymasensis DSM 11113 TaxID=1432656 RepID=A0A0X1KKM0_9EURY|nr:D-aminoacyl-tRNA deacylase [Thermococcus guaymasensis]AJC71824.1 D-tyrosyl-tRNA(Tyr) deacylase [Thermococcus guaymasensis DSM 11113]
MKVIMSTKVDLASMNIKQKLIENFGFKETDTLFDENPVFKKGDVLLLTTNEEMIYYDNLDAAIEAQLGVVPELIVFASRHSSKAKMPALTTHVTGNWGKAMYGGKDRSLAIAHPTAMKLALLKLSELNDLGWTVCYEATHHGPSELNVPSLFVEIGSGEEEWVNDRAGEILAETIVHVLENAGKKRGFKPALGIGGGHYAPKQTKRALESELAFGHILPKYAQPVEEDTLIQAIERTWGGVEAIYVDWKGTKGEMRKTARALAEKLGLEFIRD